MACRQKCCGGAGVASWTYIERTGATSLDLAAGETVEFGIVNVFTLLSPEGVQLESRACAGTCGGAQWLDVTVQGLANVKFVQFVLAEGPSSTQVGVQEAVSDYRIADPGTSTSTCMTDRWTFRVHGPWIQLTASNWANGVAELDVFATLRGGG